MHKYKCNDKLSSLARGRGLLDGGVEIECFTDDVNTFSLTGQPLICASKSRGGAYSKPYKPHCLTLPKTYVTRKGPIVLFTAPEDMVLGHACQLHKREITSCEAAHQLKSSRGLVESALAYEGHQEKEIKVKGEAWMKKEEEEGGKKDFQADLTKVYLNSLQRAAQKARKAPEGKLSVEDMEVVGEILDTSPNTQKVRPDSSVDSGLGSVHPSSAQVLSPNRLQDPTFSSSSRASKSLLDEPDTLGLVEDDLLKAYKPTSSKKPSKKSPPRKGKGSRKSCAKGSVVTHNASTQKDSNDQPSTISTRTERLSLEHVDSGMVADTDCSLLEGAGAIGGGIQNNLHPAPSLMSSSDHSTMLTGLEELKLKGYGPSADVESESMDNATCEEKGLSRQEDVAARIALQEEEERRQREEMDRRLKEEEERRQSEEMDRRLKEDGERKRREEMDKRLKEDEERKRRELDEQKRVQRLREDERRQAILQKEEKAKFEHNSRMRAELADLRYSQSISRSFYFSYFTHVPQKTRESIKTDKRKPKSRKN